MGESLIVRKGGGSSGGSGDRLTTEIILEDTNWVAPKAKNQKFSVRIFGGGGGGGTSNSNTNNEGSGGGGGWMNNALLNIPAGTSVQISIGRGG